MENYKITRKKASKMLNLSTRSVDRYIKSGKLRIKKDWKTILIHKEDIEKLMSSWDENKQEVIIPKKKEEKEEKKEKTKVEIKKWDSKKEHMKEIIEEPETEVQSSTTTIIEKKNSLETIYNDLREEINRKDDVIQNLSIKLGRAEEIAKNSISLIEFKKSQFLLEESRWYLSKEVEQLNTYKKTLKKKLRYEKRTNYILLTFTIILFATMVVVWFSKI